MLNLPLKDEDPGRVDALLAPQEDRPISDFAALGRPVGPPKPRNLLKLLDRLAFVRSFPVQSNLREFLPRSRLDHLAEEGRRLTAQHLAQYEPKRRRATIMARLFELSETLTDEVLDMHDRLMVSYLRDAEREGLAVYQQQGPKVLERLSTYQ